METTTSKLKAATVAIALSTVLASGSASATDLLAAIDSWSGSYREANITVRDNVLDGGGTIAVQQTDVGIVARSDTGDRIVLDVTSRALGYSELDATVDGNQLSDGSAIVVQQGVVGVVTN